MKETETRELLKHLEEKLVTLQQEKMLAEKQTYYLREVILRMPGNVYVKDIHDTCLACNDGFANIIGLNPEDIVGKQGKDFIDEANAKYIAELDRNIIQQGTEVVSEESGLDKNGNPAVYLTRKIPFSNKTGKTIGLIGISFDITKEKEAEQLARDKAIADQTIQTLESIVGSLAHELKTPLAGIELAMQSSGAIIRSLVHYYEDTESGKEPWPISQDSLKSLKSTLPKIKQQLKNAEIIIDLQLQSIENKAIDTQLFSQQSMANIVHLAITQYPFTENQRALLHGPNKEDFIFWGEPHLMIHVLYNLIKNALHSIKEAGKGEIFISLDRGQQNYYLKFKDTAMGMPPEVAARAFEKFYTRSRGGTGLGLSFCQTVMKAFKGDMSCESKEGEYALFTLRFPKKIKRDHSKHK